jgi:hypothetical protein
MLTFMSRITMFLLSGISTSMSLATSLPVSVWHPYFSVFYHEASTSTTIWSAKWHLFTCPLPRGISPCLSVTARHWLCWASLYVTKWYLKAVIFYHVAFSSLSVTTWHIYKRRGLLPRCEYLCGISTALSVPTYNLSCGFLLQLPVVRARVPIVTRTGWNAGDKISLVWLGRILFF